jgi:hypothetical protein
MYYLKIYFILYLKIYLKNIIFDFRLFLLKYIYSNLYIYKFDNMTNKILIL